MEQQLSFKAGTAPVQCKAGFALPIGKDLHYEMPHRVIITTNPNSSNPYYLILNTIELLKSNSMVQNPLHSIYVDCFHFFAGVQALEE